MPERVPFLNKILSRLDRLDQKSVQSYVQNLVRENQWYRGILDHLQEGVLLVGDDLRLRYCNRRAALWLGVDPDEVRDKPLGEGMIQDLPLCQFLQKTIGQGADYFVQDFHLLAPRELDLRVFLIPLEPRDSGETLVLLDDISPESRRRMQKKMEVRDESLVRLAAGIAHEIGNPLNAINIHLNLLKREAQRLDHSGPVLKKIDVLTEETQRLDGIVRNFLKAARKAPLRFRLDDLNDVLKESLDFMRPEFGTRGIEIKLRSDLKLGNFLFDRERIRDVFINLLKNAMEAMPEGGTVRISVSHKENVVLVRISDEGHGITGSHLPHIFEAYYTTKKDGAGLGLWMVHQAIAEHGGRIDVATGEGKGTIFTILLPIRREKLQLPAYKPGETLKSSKG